MSKSKHTLRVMPAQISRAPVKLLPAPQRLALPAPPPPRSPAVPARLPRRAKAPALLPGFLNEAIIQDSKDRFDEHRIAKRIKSKALHDGPRHEITPQQKRGILSELLANTNSPTIAARTLERIIAGNDLVGVNYLALGTRASRSVCRVNLFDGSGRLAGYGTGFLVAPNVLMTNNHVLGSDIEASHAIAEFDYELDVNGAERSSVRFALLPQQGFVTNKALDFSIVVVAPRSQDSHRSLSDYGFLPLRPRPGKSFEGEYLTIIQHPGGERKQVCVRENKLLQYLDNTIWYETDTVAGSSGSPVFNGLWEVVALHHSGVPATDKQGRQLAIDGRVWDASMGETKQKWKANEGIRISRIVDFLRSNKASDAVARNLLNASVESTQPRANQSQSADGGAANGNLLSGSALAGSIGDGSGTVIKVQPNSVFIQFGGKIGTAVLTDAGRRQDSAPPNDGALRLDTAPLDDQLGVEKVVINQKNYNQRPGYDQGFLGKGALAVPLPGLTKEQRANAVRRIDGSKSIVLDYYNYSVVMNRTRKLAFFSAVNIDGSKRRDTGKREGDTWFLDPRIPEKFQVGDKFYASVKIKEAARVRVFDRGHLVRRLDATWGATEREAKRNGDDTFHFTNCTPQHFQFNQGHDLWAGIEDFVLFHAENDQQLACVINGPIFRKNDETREGVKIPQQYFKIAVFVKDGALAAGGFVLSQASLLARDLPEEEEALKPLDLDEAKAFQVKISKIEELTDLDFGPLSKRDEAMRAFEAARALQPLESLSDIRM